MEMVEIKMIRKVNVINLASILVVIFLMIIVYSCGSGGSSSAPPENVPPPEEINFSGIGTKGIFDPSLAFDPSTNRIWMSYSVVGDSVMWPGQNDTIGTRLAYSDDAGTNWQDAGLEVNTALDVVLPLPSPNDAGTWNHEVSAIVYDPAAPVNERWKMLWHHYLWVNGARHFEHGWIAMRTAPAPDGPWSSERKLFVGSMYNTVNDVTIGPPEVQLDQLDVELNNCLTFSEPGMVATTDALYVVMLGAETPPDNRIVLLKWPYSNPSGLWEYIGSFLVGNVDAASFGYDGFNAPDMFTMGSNYYLIVTPQTANKYLGTFIFEIEDLDTATLKRSAGIPDLVLEFYGEAGTHNGASGYISEATSSGIIYSEVFVIPPLFFRIYKSNINP